jgi:hypothetical protein
MSTNTIRAILLIYLGLIVGVVSGYVVGFTIYQPQISQLESDISTKDAQISQLQSNLTDVQNNITSLQGQINALNSTLLNTQTELEEAIVNITSLETQLEETQAELMPGRIPILHVGDYWITEFVDNATTYTVTQNITGEGTDYYLMYSAYDPPYRGTINSTGWLDKSTLNPIRMQGHSNYTYDTTTTPYTYNSTILYTYQGGVPFPLIIGKEFNMTETIAYNMTMNSTTYTYIMNNSYTYKVEAIENVTVPAGTFTCFRMNYYNATSGDLIYIFWWSDVVKNAVKHMDYSTTPEMTYELKDYSV